MMMQGLRNAGQSWLGKLLVAVLFGFLILSFAIWGIGDIFRGSAKTTVATVGKTEIGLEQVRNAYQLELQRLSRRFRQTITPDQARALGLDQQVLSRLLTEATLDTEAKALGLGISDATVAQSIIDDPTFRRADGEAFDRALFNELLRQNGLTESMYVAEQRGAVLRNQLAEAVAGAMTAPLALQEAQHRYRNEERVLASFVVPPSAAGDIPAPTPEALAAFFDERKASFRAPELRSARVLALTPSLIADPAAVSEADARAYYETIKGRYGTPERRTVQQIVFPTVSEAEAAKARLAAGADFAAIAGERGIGESDLTLGVFARNEMVDQRIAAVAFALPINTVSEPVAGALGHALVRVTEIAPESVRPFAEVEGEVRRELAVQRAARAIADLHDKIEDMRASARPLAEIAAELKLPMVAFGPVDRQRQTPTGQALPPVPAVEQLVEAMFRSEIGSDNEPLRTRDNGYVWYELTAIEPARDRALSEVRETVEAQWRQEQIASRLQAKAREAVERLDKGEAIATVATSLGAAVTTSPPLTRTSSDPAYPASVLVAAFGTRVGSAGSAALSADAGRMVFQVVSAATPPFLRTAQQTEQAAQELSLALGDDVLVQYVSALQARLGVRINQQNLRNALGGGDS